MLGDLDNFYLNQEEPTKSTLLALRDFILGLDDSITNEWKYRMPMFCYKGKMFCYLWKDKDTKEPYIGMVDGNKIEHPLLEQGNRARMKILRINPNLDLPLETMNEIFEEALSIRNKTKGK